MNRKMQFHWNFGLQLLSHIRELATSPRPRCEFLSSFLFIFNIYVQIESIQIRYMNTVCTGNQRVVIFSNVFALVHLAFVAFPTFYSIIVGRIVGVTIVVDDQ